MAQKGSVQKEGAQNSLAQNSTRICANCKNTRRTNSKGGASRTPARRAVSVVSFFFSLIVLTIPIAGEARAQSDRDWASIQCRGNTSALLDYDRVVLCFDGPIEQGLDLSIYRGLK